VSRALGLTAWFDCSVCCCTALLLALAGTLNTQITHAPTHIPPHPTDRESAVQLQQHADPHAALFQGGDDDVWELLEVRCAGLACCGAYGACLWNVEGSREGLVGRHSGSDMSRSVIECSGVWLADL